MSYKIALEQHIITFSKLDTDEYEFTTTFNYMEYYGKSFLKSLAFVREMGAYLEDMCAKIKVDYMDKFIMVQMPVPYSEEFELIKLTLVEVDEFKKINIIIQKSSDAFKKQLSDIKSASDAEWTERMGCQSELNNELKSRLKIVESKYNKLNDQLSNMVKKSTQELHYLLCTWPGPPAINIIDINFLHESDEKAMITYIKNNINICMSGLTDQYVYDLKQKEHTLMSLFNSCTLLGGNGIFRLIKLMGALKYKITNNSYIKSSEIFIEYTIDDSYINYEYNGFGIAIPQFHQKLLNISERTIEIVNIASHNYGVSSIIYNYQ